jgi:MFS family permease
MLLGGVAFGSLRSLYPVVAAQNSTPQERGQAMAVVGLYWAVGMLIVPFAFGLIGDAIGIRPTLYLFSGIAVSAALLTPLLAYWWRDQPTVGAIRAPRAPR